MWLRNGVSGPESHDPFIDGRHFAPATSAERSTAAWMMGAYRHPLLPSGAGIGAAAIVEEAGGAAKRARPGAAPASERGGPEGGGIVGSAIDEDARGCPSIPLRLRVGPLAAGRRRPPSNTPAIRGVEAERQVECRSQRHVIVRD